MNNIQIAIGTSIPGYIVELDQKLSLNERLQHKLSLFFTDIAYSNETIEEELDNGNIFFKPLDILPFLQTALLDEKIVEVELNGITQVYFSRVHDHPPDTIEENADNDNTLIEMSDYTVGDYLKTMSHLILLPVEPGMGNFNIRYTRTILLRFFTTTYAVELGSFFQDIITVRKLPVLRLDYPVVGRIVRGAREYRAKVPGSMDIKVIIPGKRKQKNITTRLLNISASGFSFSIKKHQQEFFVIDEVRTMQIIIADVLMVNLKGNVRHITKIRGKKGTEFSCGIKADLVTRALAAQLEKIVATVQRAHLREIAELSLESGLNLIT